MVMIMCMDILIDLDNSAWEVALLRMYNDFIQIILEDIACQARYASTFELLSSWLAEGR